MNLIVNGENFVFLTNEIFGNFYFEGDDLGDDLGDRLDRVCILLGNAIIKEWIRSCRKVYFIIYNIIRLFEINVYYYCNYAKIPGCSQKFGSKNHCGVCMVTSYYLTYNLKKIKFNPIKLPEYIEMLFADL